MPTNPPDEENVVGHHRKPESQEIPQMPQPDPQGCSHIDQRKQRPENHAISDGPSHPDQVCQVLLPGKNAHLLCSRRQGHIPDLGNQFHRRKGTAPRLRTPPTGRNRIGHSYRRRPNPVGHTRGLAVRLAPITQLPLLALSILPARALDSSLRFRHPEHSCSPSSTSASTSCMPDQPHRNQHGPEPAASGRDKNGQAPI